MKIANDKLLHIGVGLAIYAAAIVVMPSYDALALVVLVAVGKEIYDMAHPARHLAETMDIIATMSIPALITLADVLS